MRLQKKILILIITLTSISCKNDDNDIYPVKFVFSDISFGEVKTYTNSGDKNDPYKINSFLENYRVDKKMSGTRFIRVTGSLLNIFENQTINIPFKLNDEIELISESKAKITSNDTVIYFDLIRKNGVLYFQSLDSTTGIRDLSEPDNRPYYLKPFYLWNEKLKYSPIQIDTFTVNGTGYAEQKLLFKPCIYATESKDEIQISYTCYVESNLIPVYTSKDLVPEGYYYELHSEADQNIQNDFNQDYLQTFQNDDKLKKDTIVYKTNKVIFKRKTTTR
jgi:hypothetical protein